LVLVVQLRQVLVHLKCLAHLTLLEPQSLLAQQSQSSHHHRHRRKLQKTVRQQRSRQVRVSAAVILESPNSWIVSYFPLSCMPRIAALT
jgi:hypothetical protein